MAEGDRQPQPATVPEIARLRIKPTMDLHDPARSFTPFLRLLDVMGLDGLHKCWVRLEPLGLESSKHTLGDLMLELLGLESGQKVMIYIYTHTHTL